LPAGPEVQNTFSFFPAIVEVYFLLAEKFAHFWNKIPYHAQLKRRCTASLDFGPCRPYGAMPSAIRRKRLRQYIDAGPALHV
jgi:hypothetical protein